SLVDGDWYKGITENYLNRLEQHNRGESAFTSKKMPWRLIFVQAFETKRDALIQERKLKRCNKKYLQWLIAQPVNIWMQNIRMDGSVG
ncbi:GIY-YIG nuclease family protein, partial [Hydrotalea sp.]|uniref:GIY-YIG nuclease family protein n=1 Tax=Hydrotalea sp. TaxID=2881279 RepID=UPI00258DEDF2